MTGPDNVVFCQRVSDSPRDVWVLYGPPLIQVDADGSRHCGQAMVLPEFLSTYSEN
ncbi:MAG TPA: hypothetical protein DCS39_04645 [Rhodobiaceae bacterium]|nr:hypothetical protein [Rhodobiaceae bacterium]